MTKSPHQITGANETSFRTLKKRFIFALIIDTNQKNLSIQRKLNKSANEINFVFRSGSVAARLNSNLLFDINFKLVGDPIVSHTLFTICEKNKKKIFFKEDLMAYADLRRR